MLGERLMSYSSLSQILIFLIIIIYINVMKCNDNC